MTDHTNSSREDWEGDLRNIWDNFNDEGGHDTRFEEIRDFVKSLLQQREEEVRREILARLPKELPMKEGIDLAATVINCGHEYFNVCLQEVRHIIHPSTT